MTKRRKTMLYLGAMALALSLAACGGKGADDAAGTGSVGTANVSAANAGDTPLVREDAPQTENQGAQSGAAGQQGNSLNLQDGSGGIANGTGNGGFDFSSIGAGNDATDTILSQYDEATRQAMIEDGKANGYDISFGADGTTKVVEPDGSVVIQNPDGTWTFQDADGSSSQYGGNWPDNEFTRLVPKPEMDVLAADTTAEDFSIAFSGATIEQIKAYAEKLKTAGFTVDPEEENQEAMGMVIYNYGASNADGYRVSVFYASGTSGLSIEKE